MTVIRIQCPQRLDRASGRDLLAAVRRHDLASGQTVSLDFAQTESVDSHGGAWLVRIAELVRSKDCDFRWDGQRDQVAQFIDLIQPGLVTEVRRWPPLPGPLERLGEDAISFWAELKGFLDLFVDSVYWTFLGPMEGKRFRWALCIDEMYEMGVRGLRINFLMNFLLGMIVAMLSAAQLEQFGAGILVADLVMIAFARELAAVMTAVVVSARTGAAIAAELATMRVQEEIDALRGMGLNVSQFLVAPKMLALLIVMPCLTAMGMVSGIVGSALWGIFVMGYASDAWFHETLHAADLGDVCQGMLKTLFFAVTIVLVGCHNGLRVQGGARGVGLMTTRAVVMDIFFIVIIDMVFAAVFYYVLD